MLLRRGCEVPARRSACPVPGVGVDRHRRPRRPDTVRPTGDVFVRVGYCQTNWMMRFQRIWLRSADQSPHRSGHDKMPAYWVRRGWLGVWRSQRRPKSRRSDHEVDACGVVRVRVCPTASIPVRYHRNAVWAFSRVACARSSEGRAGEGQETGFEYPEPGFDGRL